MPFLESYSDGQTIDPPMSWLVAQTIVGLVTELSLRGQPLFDMQLESVRDPDTEEVKVLIANQIQVQNYRYVDPVSLEDYELVLYAARDTLTKDHQPTEAEVSAFDHHDNQAFTLVMRADLTGGFWVDPEFDTLTDEQGIQLIRVLEDSTLIDNMSQQRG